MSLPNKVVGCVFCGVEGVICDSSRPSCTRCQQDGRQCVYNRDLGDHVYDLFGPSFNLNGRICVELAEYHSDDGTFSIMYQTRTLDGSTLVGVKVLCDSPSLARKILLPTLRQSLAWKRLEHPNIVPLLGVVDYAEICRQGVSQLCLVVPWMPSGNIMEYIEQRPSANVIPLLHDILDGLLYLHEGLPTPLVHGDLKGRNVLIDDSNGRPTARLTDMGIQSIWEDSADHEVIPLGLAPGRFENARWMARERLVSHEYGLKQAEARSVKSDVFELMRTVYEILTERKPFAEDSTVHAIIKIAGGVPPMKPTPEHAWEEIWGLMTACWSGDPAQRPTLAAIRAQLPEVWSHGSCVPQQT